MISLLFGNKITAALCIALLLALAGMGVMRWQLSGLRDKITLTEERVARLVAINAEYEKAALRQNAAIAQLQQQADTRAKEAAKAVAAAKKEAQSHERQAQAILMQRVSDDDCKAAAELINGYISHVQK